MLLGNQLHKTVSTGWTPSTLRSRTLFPPCFSKLPKTMTLLESREMTDSLDSQVSAAMKTIPKLCTRICMAYFHPRTMKILSGSSGELINSQNFWWTSESDWNKSSKVTSPSCLPHPATPTVLPICSRTGQRGINWTWLICFLLKCTKEISPTILVTWMISLNKLEVLTIFNLVSFWSWEIILPLSRCWLKWYNKIDTRDSLEKSSSTISDCRPLKISSRTFTQILKWTNLLKLR